MSTSAELRLRDGRAVVLRAVAYDDPVARELVARVQQEYVVRYGGPDAAVVDPGEFRPPAGLFLVAEVDGVPAGCGAWRAHGYGRAGDGVVELKRVYVEPAFRRLGLAQVVMAALELGAVAAGHRSAVLNSGNRQPEALALYAGLGYSPVPGYGIYAGEAGAVFLGKDLTGTAAAGADIGPAEDEEERPWAS
jgi:GNAT superfamily N-acetyltransferase